MRQGPRSAGARSGRLGAEPLDDGSTAVGQRNRLTDLLAASHEILGVNQLPVLELLVPADEEVLRSAIELDRAAADVRGTRAVDGEQIQQGSVSTMQRRGARRTTTNSGCLTRTTNVKIIR